MPARHLPTDPQFLSPSLTRTICPYKGIASYWSVTTGDTLAEDAAWTYPEPLGEALQTLGHAAFLGQGVATTVDDRQV